MEALEFLEKVEKETQDRSVTWFSKPPRKPTDVHGHWVSVAPVQKKVVIYRLYVGSGFKDFVFF